MDTDDVIQDIMKSIKKILADKVTRELTLYEIVEIAMEKYDKDILGKVHETEKEIIEEIRYFKGEKTMIIIAHRLTTVQHCDRIYVLENGKIIRQGTPKNIL